MAKEQMKLAQPCCRSGKRQLMQQGIFPHNDKDCKELNI